MRKTKHSSISCGYDKHNENKRVWTPDGLSVFSAPCSFLYSVPFRHMNLHIFHWLTFFSMLIFPRKPRISASRSSSSRRYKCPDSGSMFARLLRLFLWPQSCKFEFSMFDQALIWLFDKTNIGIDFAWMRTQFSVLVVYLNMNNMLSTDCEFTM